MTQANQSKNQISDLKVEVKKDDGTTTIIETPEIKTTAEDGTTVTIVDTAATSYEAFAENAIKSNSGIVEAGNGHKIDLSRLADRYFVARLLIFV